MTHVAKVSVLTATVHVVVLVLFVECVGLCLDQLANIQVIPADSNGCILDGCVAFFSLRLLLGFALHAVGINQVSTDIHHLGVTSVFCQLNVAADIFLCLLDWNLPCNVVATDSNDQPIGLVWGDLLVKSLKDLLAGRAADPDIMECEIQLRMPAEHQFREDVAQYFDVEHPTSSNMQYHAGGFDRDWFGNENHRLNCVRTFEYEERF